MKNFSRIFIAVAIALGFFGLSATAPASARPAQAGMPQFSSYLGVALPMYDPASAGTARGGWSIPAAVAGTHKGMSWLSDTGHVAGAHEVKVPTDSTTYKVLRFPGSCFDIVETHTRKAGVTFPTIHGVGVWDKCNAGATAQGGWVWYRFGWQMECQGLTKFDATEQRYTLQVFRDGPTDWSVWVQIYGSSTGAANCDPQGPPGSSTQAAWSNGTRLDGSTTGAVAVKTFGPNGGTGILSGSDMVTHRLSILTNLGSWSYMVAANKTNIANAGFIGPAPYQPLEGFSGTDANQTQDLP